LVEDLADLEKIGEQSRDALIEGTGATRATGDVEQREIV
jgi:hypothetical protein